MGLSLPQTFTDGMVLQRDMAVPVWGTATPGAEVVVSIQGQRVSARSDESGSWCCQLQPLHASEGEVLEVACANERLVLCDVAVGEVFVAGGQSNMEFWMRYERNLQEALPGCEDPHLRFFDMPKLSYPGQELQFDFSKMGRWRKATPEDLEYFSAVGYYFGRVLRRELGVPVGIVGCNYGGTKSSAWMSAEHARALEPEQVAAFERKLRGLTISELVALAHENPRSDKGYATWPAWNELFLPRTPTPEEIKKFMAEEAARARAAGVSTGPRRPGAFTPTKEIPGALYEHMVLRLAPFAVRGVLWYQGESDDEDKGAQARHATALLTIMADWRDAWGRSELPFLVVQLPGFGSCSGIANNDWVTIRRCQQEATDSDAHAWLCSAGDAGEELDIHPKDKRVLGERLALLALRHLFGAEVLADAPRCVEASRDGAEITLRFEDAGEGMRIASDVPCALAVATPDGGEVGYRAHADGDTVTLLLDADVVGPLEVRLAQCGWYCIDLTNSASIPALPFARYC